MRRIRLISIVCLTIGLICGCTGGGSDNGTPETSSSPTISITPTPSNSPISNRIAAAREPEYTIRATCTPSRRQSSSWGSSAVSNNHATQIVTDDGETVLYERGNVFPTGLPDLISDTELESANVRIRCRYQYNGPTANRFQFDLFQFLPAKGLHYWETDYPSFAPRSNGMLFTVSPLSDLHYKIYKSRLAEGYDWDSALVQADLIMFNAFSGEKHRPVAINDDFLYADTVQAANEERLIFLAEQLTGANLSDLNDLIAENAWNCTIPLICISVLRQGRYLLSNANFDDELEDWDVVQRVGTTSSGGIGAVLDGDGERSIRLELVSNRPSTESERPVIGIVQDYTFSPGDLDDVYLRADIEEITGLEGSIALFSGTGLAGLMLSYYAGDEWLGESVFANFADSGGLENIPFIRAQPVTLRSSENSHIVKLPSTANTAFTVSVTDEIDGYLPAVSSLRNSVDRIQVSAFVSDFHNVNDPIVGTQCRDCRATLQVKSLELVTPF